MAYSGNWPTFLSFDADIQGHKMFPLKKNLKTSCSAYKDATNEDVNIYFKPN